MASSKEFADFVMEQAAGTGVVTSRKMFGEYMVYIDGKPILLICDNTVYVKMLDCVADELLNAEIGTPYDGAKPHYILDIENRELVCKVIELLKPVIALPKSAKKK